MHSEFRYVREYTDNNLAPQTISEQNYIKIRCVKCNSLVDETSTFCQSCGNKMIIDVDNNNFDQEKINYLPVTILKEDFEELNKDYSFTRIKSIFYKVYAINENQDFYTLKKNCNNEDKKVILNVIEKYDFKE